MSTEPDLSEAEHRARLACASERGHGFYLSGDYLIPLLAEYDRRGAELERLHSWAGLMSLLDEHWPAAIFPGGEASDPGPRIVGLVREVDRRGAEITLARSAIKAEADAVRDLEAELVAVRSELDRYRAARTVSDGESGVRARDAAVSDSTRPGVAALLAHCDELDQAFERRYAGKYGSTANINTDEVRALLSFGGTT